MAPAQPQPEWFDYARALAALVFVAGLIFFLGLGLKRFGLDKRIIGNKGPARLQLVETLYLDPRHRLMIVRQDDKEHLLLISPAGDMLIHSSPQKSDAV